MLFDEKKMPYHLMLQKFLMSGGQNAFFDAFYWALSIGYSIPPEDGLVADLPEYTGEFFPHVWSRDFMVWRINFGLWAVAWAGPILSN